MIRSMGKTGERPQFEEMVRIPGGTFRMVGRGSWIRTNDLQYPKLPRYQAALYPDPVGK